MDIGEKIDYTDTRQLVADIWLFLTNKPLYHQATIKREAFDHEVIAMIDTVREYERKQRDGQITYTQDEVYEILRQVMFTGTPELYDQGGMHCSMKPTDTRKRAVEAFNKYYLKQRI